MLRSVDTMKMARPVLIAASAFGAVQILTISTDAFAASPKTAIDQGGCHYRLHVVDQPVTRIDVDLTCRGDGPWRISGNRLIPNDHVRNVRPGAGTTMVKDTYHWIFRGADGVTRGAYWFDMEDLTRSTNSSSIARRRGASLMTSISSILLYPTRQSLPISLRFSISAAARAKGGKIATAFRRTGTGNAVIQWLRSTDIPDAGAMVLGRFTKRQVLVPGRGSLARAADKPPYREKAATVTLAIVDPGLQGDQAIFDKFVADTATLVARYFRGFPAQRSMIVVIPFDGAAGVLRGRVVSGGGPTVILLTGRTLDRAALYNDWILAHELIHIGSPYLRQAGRWLNEGIAVYLQSVIHVRAGWLKADQIWQGFMRQMPRGLGAIQGGGLRSARGIGGVYWGGSLFLLMADVDIRQKTKGRKTLGNCLRAVLWAGGDSSQAWTPEKMMAVCDRAVGTDTMARLSAQYVTKGSPVDMGKLWRSLGLLRDENGFRYNDRAPLAAVRKAIMRAKTGQEGQ